MSQCYIHANFVKIRPSVHEISWKQENVTPTKMESAPKTVSSPPPLRWEDIIVPCFSKDLVYCPVMSIVKFTKKCGYSWEVASMDTYSWNFVQLLLRWCCNQRTTGPVSLTWVLRLCWIRTNLEIQEHSMLYKMSPIQKYQEQIWPCHKMVRVNPGSSFEKKPQGMGIQPLGTSSGSILKLLLFPSFCTRKIPFASHFTWCFVLFRTCI